MRARFGIKWLWGRVEYCSHGELAVQYSDGTLLTPYSVEQLQGAAALEGHSYFKVVQQADVPDSVVAKFAAEGWLDALWPTSCVHRFCWEQAKCMLGVVLVLQRHCG